MIERLAEDHANARRLAEALADRRDRSAGGIAQPEPGPLDPARVRDELRPVQASSADRARVPRRAWRREGVLMVATRTARSAR